MKYFSVFVVIPEMLQVSPSAESELREIHSNSNNQS
jgi:hypothetical protein